MYEHTQVSIEKEMPVCSEGGDQRDREVMDMKKSEVNSEVKANAVKRKIKQINHCFPFPRPQLRV